MANLSTIKGQIDSNVQESNGAFTVVPSGKYKACIVADDLRDNKNKNGMVLMLKLQILEGQFAQEILTDNINITNPSGQCQAIGQGTLKRICNVCNVPFPPNDTAGLMGKPMTIDVTVEEFTSNTTGKPLKSNKIKSYGPPMQMTAPVQSLASAGSHPQQQAASGW